MIQYSSTRIHVHQQKYAKDLLELAHLANSRTVDTPLELNVKFCKDDVSPIENPTLRRQHVGNLIYSTMTCPDIAYIQIVSQFVFAPCQFHLKAMYCILQYLCGTLDRRLFYSFSSPLKWIYDANWASCPGTS